MKVSDSYADPDQDIGVPMDYIRTKMFWEKFSPQSYDQYCDIPWIIYAKYLNYSKAENHGQKRANQSIKK